MHTCAACCELRVVYLRVVCVCLLARGVESEVDSSAGPRYLPKVLAPVQVSCSIPRVVPHPSPPPPHRLSSSSSRRSIHSRPLLACLPADKVGEVAAHDIVQVRFALYTVQHGSALRTRPSQFRVGPKSDLHLFAWQVPWFRQTCRPTGPKSQNGRSLIDCSGLF